MAALVQNPLFCPFSPTELAHASATFQRRPRTLFDPNPPPARARRSEGSSTDTAPTPDADGFIESDLRAGGPKLCEPPCETIRRLPTNLENRFRGPGSFQLMTKLGDICRGANVSVNNMKFCGRRSMYEPDRKPTFTLLVTAKRDASAQESWAIVSRKLFHYLRGSGSTDVSVEIMDAKFEQSPRIHACVPSDAIFPIWQQVALQIFDGIDCRGVFTIGCFRIGNHIDRFRCPPTILLGVDRAVKRDWKPVRDTIVAILDSRRLLNVAVTIRKDNKLTRASEIRSGEGIPAADCRKDPNIGTSLSPGDEKKHHGTMGGWVELRNPKNGVWTAFAITCAHCCFPRESAVSPEDHQVVQHWRQHGVRIHDENKSRLLPVDSPSYRDVMTTLDRLADRIKESELDEVYQEVEKLKVDETSFVMPFLERQWKSTADDITGYKNDRHNIKKFWKENGDSSRLGTVFAASGLREVTSTDDPNLLSIRDWALIRVSGSRSVGNNRVTIKPDRQTRKTMLLDDFSSKLPQLGQKLFKVGRSTGTTHGEYGNLKTCKIAVTIVNGEEELIPTWEHVLLRGESENQVLGGDRVVESGDSGSLVFNKSGFVLGIIFGGNSDENLGYFTATRDLIADIKHITGVQEIRIHKGVN